MARSDNEDRSNAGRPNDQKQAGGKYNTPQYFENNRMVGSVRDVNRVEDEPSFYNDTIDRQYDEFNTGKYENYSANGYYGSNYGSVNYQGGRDYEQNAGYRESYNRLTTGNWPENERSSDSRKKIEGLHRGKGPKNYRRSDTRIKDEINDILYEDQYIDASEIEVNVENGEVIISGTVDDRSMKRRVDDVIERIAGVKQYENRLRVKMAGGKIVNVQNG